VEEKYGKEGADADDDLLTSTSDEESEDDAGDLVTEHLDAEISATLQAIRNKDPRVYDAKIKFYSEVELAEQDAAKEGKVKPMFLKEYHRKNLLENSIGPSDEDAPRTYVQEQEALKQDIVKAMHAEAGDDSEDEEDGFLVRKTPRQEKSTSKNPIPDPAQADREPETFLSNFLSSRAWVPTSTTGFQELESDDDEEEDRADAFEAAYNLRFEDPEKSNEKLLSHARDAAAKYSVRREEKSGRKSQREKERQKKEEEKKKRETDRARLKKLRMEQMEGKIEKIRDAAGLSGKTVDIGEWATVLEEDWDDSRFDAEMRKRFGEDYYQGGGIDGSDDGSTSHSRRKKPKKPTWDDDIDIKDLVPDFEEGDEPNLAALSDDDDQIMEDANGVDSSQHKVKKSVRADAKATARRDRRLIEALVDQSLPLETAASSSKSFTPFRYRETTPTDFGLTALDILAADDAQLNEFVGLKKLAAWRDADRKKKDKKKLGKKARLRQWRRETFGTEEGPRQEEIFAPEPVRLVETAEEGPADVGTVREGERKKKRKRSSKPKTSSQFSNS
jgi:protein KRI1